MNYILKTCQDSCYNYMQRLMAVWPVFGTRSLTCCIESIRRMPENCKTPDGRLKGGWRG